MAQTDVADRVENGSGSGDGGAGEAGGAEAFEFQDLAEQVAGEWQAWVGAIGLVALAIVAGFVVHWVVFRLVRRASSRTRWKVDDIVLSRLRGPATLLFPLIAVQLVRPAAEAMTPASVEVVGHVFALLLILLIVWLLVAALGSVEGVILSRYDTGVSDNLQARRVHTQLRIIRRVIVTFLVVVGVGAALMTFPAVRQFGTSILASAGLAGLVIGLAARPSVENLIAGVQVAMAQPIRLDDVVIVDGEWGRIEEITTTYVVVRIWDQRRLIVPFGRFLNDSFQNWTRTSAEILGTVFLHTDYTAPVQALREKVEEICKASPNWDGRVAGLVVTDARERTLELRALVSAASSGQAWDLRCEVREKLIDFLQREHPGCLPRVRAEVEGEAVARAGEREEGPPGEV